MTAREFLLARVAEREKVAKAAAARVRRWPKTVRHPWQRARQIAQQERSAPLEAFEARETPEQVLAWCAAIRAVAELHRPSHGSTRPDDAHECPRWEWQHPDDQRPPCTDTGYTGDCETLILLCRVFADHPEFDVSWAASSAESAG